MSQTYPFQITNGAAHSAFGFLKQGLSSLDDIYTGGSISKKLKGAKSPPAPKSGEINHEYEPRLEEWLDAPYPAFEVDEEERDVLKVAIKALAEKKQLPSHQYTVELIELLGLNKKEKP